MQLATFGDAFLTTPPFLSLAEMKPQRVLSSAASVSLVAAAITHYPPASTTTNNLTFALDGHGAPGIYNSSTTPDATYGIYNWCNMPHVRQREYKRPSSEFVLEYVEVIHRHHKRTPYSSNTFFKEDVQWSCDGEGPRYGATSGNKSFSIQWQASTNQGNPWTSTLSPGFVGSTCQFPQITDQGVKDSFDHGADLRGVYSRTLGLSSSFDPKIATIRVTNNVITSQVASGLLAGLFPESNPATLAAFIQPSSIDSLEPTYPCPRASSIRSAYTTGSDGQQWQEHLTKAAALYAKLDSVSGISNPDSGGWHTSFDHYYDNLSAKQCHGKPLPCSLNDTSLCVTQDDADTVYRLGNWEYSYQFRDAPASAQYAALRYGAWMLELQAHLLAKMNGTSPLKYSHNIAHDGSISPLLGFLQIEEMVWPGMGSEIVFELFRRDRSFFVRVLWGGQVMRTSTPLGPLDMVPIQTFFAYIDGAIGEGTDLMKACAN